MPSSASIVATSPLGRVSIIVEEVLGAVFAPARREAILAEALATAELDAIPDRPASLRVFVDGALFATLARHLEVSDALEHVEQIRAALDLALSSVEDDRPISDIRERMGHAAAAPSRVLVATQASLVVFLLQDVVGDDVEVMPVSDASILRDRLRRLAGLPLLVVVDRKHPCVGPGVADVLARELDEHSTVVWWGAQEAETLNLERQLVGGPRLLACPFDRNLADLGDLCRELIR